MLRSNTMQKYVIQNSKGQTLVTLLFFMVIAITVTTGAVIIVFANTTGQTKLQQSQTAYYIAESGMENSLIRLLRDPSYTGETLPVGEGTAITTINGSGPYTITATGTVGSFVRTVQVVANYTNNILTVQSWKETF